MADATKIAQRRHWALVIVRAVGLLMMLYGSIDILRGLGTFFGLSLGGSSMLSGFTTFWGNENYNPFWHGLAVFTPGLIVALVSRRIARWMIPVLRHECPQCGYALRQLTTARCPECGFAIDSSGEKPSAPSR